MIFIAKQHKFCRFAAMKQFVLDKGRQIAVHFHQNLVGQKPASPTGFSVPLVLLHGFCEDSSLWDGLIPLLPDIPILSIDLPGFGESDLPQAPDMAAYSTAVKAVLDALQVERCVLVGHSLGGYVALEFAARFGDGLAGLGLFHSHPFPDDDARKNARMRGIEMLRSGKRDLYVAQLFPNLFAPAYAQAHPEIVQAMIEKGKQQPAEGIVGALQAMMGRADHQETLKNVRCPVLFLLGSADGLVPVDQALKAAMLPDMAQVEVLDGVRHMGMFEAEGMSAGALLNFRNLVVFKVSGFKVSGFRFT